MSKEEKYDVVVVGGGPAGLTAAYVMAKAGLEVILLERGEYCGSKNMFGGMLFTTVVAKLMPEVFKEAPLERNVTRRKFSLLTPDGELSGEYKFNRFNTPPYNNSFTVLRAKFDKWYAKKAEEAGALIIEGAVADDFVKKDGKIAGVRTRLEGGEIYADAVILADGVNSLLAKKLGMHRELDPKYTIVSVKEVLALPESTIADRFSLNGNEGVAYEYFGYAVKGALGAGFLYTNRNSISIGVGGSVKSLLEHKYNPNDILEYFKNHPVIAPLIKGGEQKEYSAHLIPDGGYNHISKLVADNVLVVGDAGGFVNNTLFHEGTNLAMESGRIAGEAVVEAKKKNDFSKAMLGRYKKELEQSFVLRDLKQFRKLTDTLDSNTQIFDKYPQMMENLVSELFSVDGEPKKAKERKIFKKLLKDGPVFKLIKTVLAMRRVII